VNGDLHFEWFSRLLGGPLGRWAARRHAILVNVLMPATMRRRTLEADEMAAYRAPFADPASRTPTHVLPDEIRRAGAWLDAVERTVAGFRGPVHLIWPDRDIAFREKELAHWRTLLPQATVTRLANCGHYLWEDAPQECLDALVGFLAASGAGAGNRGARVQTGCTGRDAIV
jgi:haloalkane dehalogenase